MTKFVIPKRQKIDDKTTLNWHGRQLKIIILLCFPLTVKLNQSISKPL